MFINSKISYSVNRNDFDNSITSRFIDISITSTSERECSKLFQNLFLWVEAKSNSFEFAECEQVKEGIFKMTYLGSVKDREKYNEFKESYKHWKNFEFHVKHK